MVDELLALRSLAAETFDLELYNVPLEIFHYTPRISDIRALRIALSPNKI
jgi:hypothetical protein